jgi:TRAP-type transport system periplasmic protein
MSTMTTFEVAQQIADYGLFNRAYLFRDYDHLRAVFDGPIGETYRRTVADKMGIEILAVAYLGTRQVNLRQKRGVKAPADLAGIKMRMPAGPEWLLLGKAIGVSPVPLGMPEVYLALKTGSIDGQENPLSILNAAKFYEVTEQVVLTAHMVQPVFFAIAKPFWDKLVPDQKALLERAARSAAKGNDSGRLADEKAIVEALKGRGLAVDGIDLASFRALADKVYGESDVGKAWNAGLLKQVTETR